ncbi:hypothetical protein IV38_GL000534 [Lactobacillus selangorensis]|uniref:non-specific serine/threonine protein kinase n=1 Tax=Lactobacillus selangorensis TaxID=81857 RepID=A0A0R2FM17_9LACO|nr:Stk1 family PASTA domain-containing Ser/Thr kinase [Lactobacillus selangorensis]KRN29647.1 hypothetical protein IV38_GL000534 [Lactobacillus selangorensis]KRN33824.1 hypothetical protein IV40_GL000134 [Lactobacillus selangorensis]
MEKGYTINGRYRILSMLGEGGMANVYLAQDLILNRQVAVKVLRLDLRNDVATERRFQREALATTELVHPNIVSIYDVGEEDGMQYIIMEYVHGTDLKKYIAKHFPIPYERVIDIMEQILSAVAVAHQHGIIHRDLKPQNILIDDQHHIKITDFGIAIAMSENSLTQTNSMLGSVHYLSPEQARGGMATKRSDIYSLGIILYELLTGKVPFEGESAVAIALQHFQTTISSVRDYDPNIPQALENVVYRATAKQPSERYASVEDMAADLKTSLSPVRKDEPKFIPEDNHQMEEETKVLSKPDLVAATDEPTQTIKRPAASSGTTPPDPPQNTPDRQSDSQKQPHKHRRWWLWVLAIVLIGVIGGWIVVQQQRVIVPDLSEMTKEQAEPVLADAGLKVGAIQHRSSDTVNEKHIIATKPKLNKKVARNTPIALVISTGPKKIKLADWRGTVYKKTRKQLEREGFTVQKETKTSKTVSTGDIISQSIASGKRVVPSETTITFVVSSGLASFKLRDLSGYSQKSVQDYAEERGLNLQITLANSETVSKDQVVSQSVTPETVMHRGDSLSVVISKGKKQTDDAASSQSASDNSGTDTPAQDQTTASSSSAASEPAAASSSSESSASEAVPNASSNSAVTESSH